MASFFGCKPGELAVQRVRKGIKLPMYVSVALFVQALQPIITYDANLTDDCHGK
jgi:hypothetical protein